MGRRLGQHFLFDPSILDRIADALTPDPRDVVLEVGAGQGTLTRRLAPRVARVVAIERDRRLAALLSKGVGGGEAGVGGGFPYANVTVVVGDALRLDWHSLVVPRLPTPHSLLPPSHAPLPTWKVIGNIPYAITSPLIDKALTPPLPAVIVFLVQREVADRLAAEPGSRTYGALTVGVQVVARVERLFTVPAGAFRPPPAVDSAAVRFTPLREPLLQPGERAAFRRLVTGLFGQRRKRLTRSVRSLAGLDRETVEARLAGAGIDPRVRPEVLAPHAFVNLYRALRR